MAWGAPRGVDDLIAKLKANTTASTMCILSTRRFGSAEAVALSAALSGNTSLQELLASGHPLEQAGAAAFGEALSRNTTLRSLCVGDNNLGDKGVLALVDGLQRNRGLLVLDLEYKSIASGEGLCMLLKVHPTLADLRLGRNRLAEAGIEALSAGLPLSSTLLRLDLSGNLLNAEAARALGRALCGRRSVINNPPAAADTGIATEENEVGASTAAAVAATALSGPPPLEFLDVSKNPLGDEGGAALFEALATSPTLTSLIVAEAGLGARAAAALAAALAPTPLLPPPTGAGDAAPNAAAAALAGAATAAAAAAAGVRPREVGSSPPPPPAPHSPTAADGRGLLLLKTLDVSKNEFSAAGTAELAGALSSGGAPQLESLFVGYNGVGDEGAAALGMAAGPRQAVLDLSGNALTGVGIAAVLSAPGLREAKLFHNACGDEGVPLVLEALLAAGALETLDLGANGLTGAGFEVLLPGLASCTSLRTLELGANSNDDRAEGAVRCSQRSNPALDIAFRRGGEAMDGSGIPAGVGVAAGPGAVGAGQTQRPSD